LTFNDELPILKALDLFIFGFFILPIGNLISIPVDSFGALPILLPINNPARLGLYFVGGLYLGIFILPPLPPNVAPKSNPNVGDGLGDGDGDGLGDGLGENEDGEYEGLGENE